MLALAEFGDFARQGYYDFRGSEDPFNAVRRRVDELSIARKQVQQPRRKVDA